MTIIAAMAGPYRLGAGVFLEEFLADCEMRMCEHLMDATMV